MKPRIPQPTHVRPYFWPWPTGQRIGVNDHVLSSDAVLFLWNCLAPTKPTGIWDPAPLLQAAGADSMNDSLLQGTLRTLQLYRLAWFDPQWAAWCKLDPQDKKPVSRPPVRDWPRKLSLDLADAWWYLEPEAGTASWTWMQAVQLCPALNYTTLERLQQAGKAEGTVRR